IRHNRGEVPHTSKWKPWRIKTYIAFSDNDRARSFEKYLKPSSGRAFLKKRLQMIPLPPVFARSAAASVDCRAGAFAEADIFSVVTIIARATTRLAKNGDVHLRLRATKRG